VLLALPLLAGIVGSAGCAGFYGGSAEDGADNALGTSAGQGSGGWRSASADSGGGQLPAVDYGGSVPSAPSANGSYAYLCGGSSADCTPGTSDCTPGGNPNISSGSGGSVIGCQLTVVEGKVTAACGPVGTFAVGDPCESAAHCAAGLGCVTDMVGGICRQYCCGNVDACPADTYCTPLLMAEAAATIPVCAPVKKCQLLDDSTCEGGQICTIVRNDGTTGCVSPGTGQRGEACPCAAGYVCASIINTCFKLCHIGNDAVDCEGGGTCQGGVTVYPDGIGVCVYPSK
jgi:hypothetical protein